MFECQAPLSRSYRRYLHILVKLKSTQNLIGSHPEGDFKLSLENNVKVKFKLGPICFNFSSCSCHNEWKSVMKAVTLCCRFLLNIYKLDYLRWS